MMTLRIEHAVADFDAWRKAFQSDPVHRVVWGVRHGILRPVDDRNFVAVDLEFAA